MRTRLHDGRANNFRYRYISVSVCIISSLPPCLPVFGIESDLNNERHLYTKRGVLIKRLQNIWATFVGKKVPRRGFCWHNCCYFCRFVLEVSWNVSRLNSQRLIDTDQYENYFCDDKRLPFNFQIFFSCTAFANSIL